jgi:[acyl-carrier-protein] S-malonyltransferase
VVDVIALLAPGQGAQTAGMLAPWLDEPAAVETVHRWSAATGLDLRRLGVDAGADEIVDTAVTQPLVVATALLAAARVTAKAGLPATAVTAGHSVGELAAAAVAGVLTPDAAVRLAAVRGREMAAACELEPTGMSAVLGGNAEEVLATLERLGLDPANRNAARAGRRGRAGGRAGGPGGRPAAACAGQAAAGGRGFHTRFMAPAEDALRAAVAELTPSDPRAPLLSNADGAVVVDGAEALTRLVAQVTRPVRWDSCTATLRELGVTALIELPPAGTLVGIAKRELRGLPTLALQTPDDLPAAVDLIIEHSGPTHDPLRLATPAARGTHPRPGQRPARHVVTNDDLTQHMDTTDEWIRDRVGIESRGSPSRAPAWSTWPSTPGRGRSRTPGWPPPRSTPSSWPPAPCPPRSRTRRPRPPSGSASRRPARSTSTPPAPGSASA